MHNNTLRGGAVGMKSQQALLEQQANDHKLAELIIGRSVAIHEIRRMVLQVARYPSTTVLLQGESGTGKDVVAHAIHELSSRSAYNFVAINCAALPDTLLETELFGVEAGAFTDAKVSREGYLSRADGGTLFLDEIGTMPRVLQAKLLRFLETRNFRRVGSTKELHVDLRIISATNTDLQAAVAQGLFRDDLYYRLKVITITLPPLRERLEDLEPLMPVADALRRGDWKKAGSILISVMRKNPKTLTALHSLLTRSGIRIPKDLLNTKIGLGLGSVSAVITAIGAMKAPQKEEVIISAQ